MKEFKLKYSISDIECLEDYFSLQIKSESGNLITVYECYNDFDCNSLYNKLIKGDRPLYFFSIGYDKTILNAFFKLVEKKQDDIVYKLRQINNYLIPQSKGQPVIDYFRLNAEFWVDNYFKFKKNDPECTHDELFERSHMAFIGRDVEYDFIKNFPIVLGQSKNFKEKIIVEIPKALRYFNIDKDKKIKPSISLKNLQLINEGYNIKFDFNKYKTIKQIKDDGLYDDFIKYSKNDISSLEKIFDGIPKEDIIKRLYAVEAVKTINPDIKVTDEMIYSENNTKLITEILKIDNPNKNIEINYNDHIHTEFNKFNRFVDYVNDFQHVIKDYDVKKSYCEVELDNKYIQDDFNIIDAGSASTQINSVDEIHILNKFNDIKIKFGFGGVHGAIPNFKSDENMVHADYASQYPSIILQYKEYFKQIINVDLYESIYNLKFEIGDKIKKLSDDVKQMYKIIGADIQELSLKINIIEREIIHLKKIQKGVKLILNYSFGLINSNFNIPISCKKLGRFICLKGQSLLLNCCSTYMNDSQLINVNTDGVILRKMTDKSINIPKDGYFILENQTVSKIIQNDVNNYIAVKNNDYLYKKGMFNIGIKQMIAKNEKLYVNTENAINLLFDKPIEIKPLYFGSRFFDTDIQGKRWYFTEKIHGEKIIKNLKKPEIMSLSGEDFYFTSDINFASNKLYAKYAVMTKEKILNFTMNVKSSNNPYFEEKLTQDSEENVKEKRAIKRKLNNIIGKNQVGFVGFKGNNKANSYLNNEPIKPLIQYTMTQVLKSTYCTGFSIENNKHNKDNPFLIIDVDIYNKDTGKPKQGWTVVKPFLKYLKSLNTFECWNSKTEKYNRKFIFFKTFDFKIQDKYKNYIEVLNKATIYTLNGLGDLKYDCNWNTPVKYEKEF